MRNGVFKFFSNKHVTPLVYAWLYVQLIVIDPYRSRDKNGMIFGIKKLRMLKVHPIKAFMKTYANFKKYFWLGFFG